MQPSQSTPPVNPKKRKGKRSPASSIIESPSENPAIHNDGDPLHHHIPKAHFPKEILQEINLRKGRTSIPATRFRPIFHNEFLKKHVNRLETSMKVLTTWNAGDLFLGRKETCQAVALDADPLGLGNRHWGGGSSKQSGLFLEGIVDLDFVELEGLKQEDDLEWKQEQSEENDESTSPLLLDRAPPSSSQHNYLLAWCQRQGVFWISVWILYLALIVALFFAAVLLAVELPDLLWAEVPAWRYCVFFGLLFALPLTMYVLLKLCAKVFRSAVDSMKHKKTPQQLQGSLEFIFLVEQLQSENTIMLTFAFYTISFLLLFNIYPASNKGWVDAYHYITATLGTITVYFLGRCVGQLATHWIAREVDVEALGRQVRKCLRAEQALWEILQVTPNPSELKLFEQMENPFLLYDPMVANKLRAGVIRTRMTGRYRLKNNTWITINGNDPGPKAALLGSWMYQSLVKRACAESTKQLARHNSSKFDTNKSLSTLPKMEGSPKLDGSPIASTASLDGSVVPLVLTGGGPSLHHASSSCVGLPLPHSSLICALDLAMLYKQRTMDIFPVALNTPASKLGTLRGCPKRNILKEDVANCLSSPIETLNHVWSEFLDPERTGKLNLRRARAVTTRLVSDRANMKAQLKSNQEVKKKLASVIGVILNFFVFFAALGIYGLDVLEVWVGISSILLAFSFVFGGTLANIFNSVVFLFGVHPYDIGDMVMFGPEETPYTVVAIRLMSTRMERWDGASIEMLNATLYALDLINVTRSSNHSITLHMRIDCAALPERKVMERMQMELEEFLQTRSSYTGACTITAREFLYPLQVRVTVWFEFAYNNVDIGRTYRDTSRVIQFLVQLFRKHNFTASGINSGMVDLTNGSVKLAHILRQKQPSRTSPAIDSD